MDKVGPFMQRMAEALERMAPSPTKPADINRTNAFIWQSESGDLRPIYETHYVDIKLLCGIDVQRKTLLANTEQFARGMAANNALLWGARGMGKSSLIKAVHAAVLKKHPNSLALVEIHREDIPSLPGLMRILRDSKRRFILFCDDLSFAADETSYKSLKTVLEGGLEGRPGNILFYATSNRRHLMARDMIDNERSTAINPYEAVEEKVSLSDRFGLWLGFHSCDQQTYLDIVETYATWLKLPGKREIRLHDALEWAITRGARSGRVAWQFIQDEAGKAGIQIER